METLLSIDHQVFLLINHLPHTLGMETIALTLSGIGMGGLIWLLLSLLIFVRVEKREHWFFLPVVLATALSELFGNVWLKDFFTRARPPVSLGTITIGTQLSDYSFPSGHATFAWALAIVLASKEPRLKYFYFALAFFISLSRIYLGNHYPADVVVGTVVGLAIGYFSLWVEQNVIKYRYDQAKRKGAPNHPGRSGRRRRH